MTVYADLVFLINFAFDLEILLIILKLSARKIPPVRLFLSACLGGVQGVFAFVPYFQVLASPPMGFLLPFLMSWMVFYPVKICECVKGGFLFLASAFLFSGAVSFLGIKAAWGLFLLIPIYFMISYLKRRATKKTVQTVLYYGGKSVRAEGFFDSGNKMTYQGIPVILANDTVFKSLFGSGFSIYAVSEWADSKDICAVPYTSLGKTGAVIGVRLEKAIIGKTTYDKVILGHFADDFSEDLILNGIMT